MDPMYFQYMMVLVFEDMMLVSLKDPTMEKQTETKMGVLMAHLLLALLLG